MILYLNIISSNQTKERQDICRETWLTKVPNEVIYNFIVGSDRTIPSELDVIQVVARDTYECLPEKVLASMRQALQLDKWDWWGKVDDDTYVYLPRLVSFLNSISHDISCIGVLIGNRGECYGRAGYFMRRKVVESIIHRHDISEYIIWPMGFEDTMIGRAIYSAGYNMQYTEKFNQFSRPEDWPTLDNDKITCHKCDKEKMYKIHTNLYKNINQ